MNKILTLSVLALLILGHGLSYAASDELAVAAAVDGASAFAAASVTYPVFLAGVSIQATTADAWIKVYNCVTSASEDATTLVMEIQVAVDEDGESQFLPGDSFIRCDAGTLIELSNCTGLIYRRKY